MGMKGDDPRVQEILDFINNNGVVYSCTIESTFSLAGSVVRDAIRVLRRSGYPVVGSDKGYYMAKTPEDFNCLIEDLQGRAFSILKTVDLLKKKREESIERGKQSTLVF